MADSGEHQAVGAALRFEHQGFEFSDFWEVNVKDWSYRFMWCCYALAWAVKQYDARSSPAGLAVATGEVRQ